MMNFLKTIRNKSLENLFNIHSIIIELIVGIIFFLTTIGIKEKIISFPSARTDDLIPFFFIIILLIFRINELTKKHKRFYYYLSPALIIPLCFIDLSAWLDSPLYIVTLFTTIVLFLLGHRPNNNKGFVEYLINACYKLCVALIFNICITLLLLGIIQAIGYLFEVPNNILDKCHIYLLNFAIFIIQPIAYFLLLMNKENEDENKNAFMLSLHFFISKLLPVITFAYIGIIYIYLLIAALHQEMPKLGLSYVVLFMLLLIIATHLLNIIESKEKTLFSKQFPIMNYLAIIPIIMLVWAIAIRVSHYGFTTSRIYLIIIASYLSFITILSIFITKISYPKLIMIGALLIGLFTYIPPISAEYLSIVNQKSILHKLGAELNALNSKNQLQQISVQTAQKYPEKIKQLESCYNYLEKYKEVEKKTYKEKYDLFAHTNYNTNILLTKEINISNYSKLYTDNNKSVSFKCKNGIINVTLDHKTVLYYDLNKDYEKFPERFTEKNTDLLEIKNDSCLLILRSIYIHKERNNKVSINAYMNNFLIK